MTTTFIPKITLKSIKATPKAGSVKEGDAFAVADIFGRVTSTKADVTAFGEYTKFIGTFEATNLATGETFSSNTLILPQLIETILNQEILNTGGDVEFAVRVIVQHSEKGATGYAFGVQPIIQSQSSDTLKSLRDAVLESRALLIK